MLTFSVKILLWVTQMEKLEETVEAEPSVPKNVKVPNTEELASVKKGLVPSEEESIEKEIVLKEKPMSNCFFHHCE